MWRHLNKGVRSKNGEVGKLSFSEGTRAEKIRRFIMSYRRIILGVAAVFVFAGAGEFVKFN